jgi:peptidoglycan/LPS O-acetylase OafA/YrhL
MTRVARVTSLDGMRGIAAVAVMSFHFNIFYLPQARLPFLGRAYLSLDLFFLLSGFVMAHVYGCLMASDWRAHWRRFALARFARIYPLFSTTTLAIVVLVALFGAPTPRVLFSGRSLALQPPLLQQWCSGLSWNYPSWSISTEAEAYLYFVFFAGLLFTGKHPRLLALCCVGVLAALSLGDGGGLNYYVGIRALLRTLAGFSLGVLLYRAYLRHTARPQQWSGVAAILFAGAFSISRLDFLAVCAFACLIYYSVNAMNAIHKLLDTRYLVVLGNWSYSIYLLHAPVQFAVMIAFNAFHHPVAQLSFLAARVRIPTKPAMHSNMKPATCSDPKPATVPI